MNRHAHVIGAGIVGVCCALALQRRGWQVTLIDRREPGQETSDGNAGVIGTGSIFPINNPGLWHALPAMLKNTHPALRFDPAYVLASLPWFCRFLSHATPASTRRRAAALQTLIGAAAESHLPLLKEAGIMHRRPRDPNSPILTRPMIRRILLVGLLLFAGSFGLFEWELYQGESVPAARTAAVNVLVFGELFYLFNCRSLSSSMFKHGVFSNPWLFVGVITMTVSQLLFTYLPVMQHVFGTANVGVTEWMLIIAVGVIVYIVVEIEKKISTSRASSPG